MHTDALNYWHISVVIFENIQLHVLSRQKTMLGGFRLTLNMFKAALINMFLLTTDQVTTHNVKGITSSDKLLRCANISVSFSPLSRFYGRQLCCFGSVS